MADNTTPKQLAAFAFKPGQSGNPSGRPKGARSKLGEAFIEALNDDFTQHGIAAIETVRSEKPDQYLKVIASLLPKDVNLNINDDRELTDEEVIERIRAIQSAVAPLLAERDGASGRPLEAARVSQKPLRVH